MDFHNDLDDNEEEEENEFMYGGRDGIIFLVDASLPMFNQGVEEEIPFKTCLECCKTTMLNKIISSDRDLVSIVLFGTKNVSNELNAAHITTLQELSEPSALKIKQLEKMIESKDFDGFAEKYGSSNDFLLSDALWLCQTIFSTSLYKLSSFRILLLTNTSDPHVGNKAAQHQARVRAGDLSQAGIQLELLHMGQHFDASIFYKDLVQLSRGDSGDDFVIPDPTSRFDELLERICRLDYKKRALCKLHFNLGNDVSLGVNLYNLVRKTALPNKVSLDRTSNEPVKAVTQYFDSQTAEVMLPAEISKCQNFGDKKIVFRFDEVRLLHKMKKPGLELLGFKPSSRVKDHHHIKPSAFIYPEEGLIKGSRVLFVALLERCAARAVVPICYLTPRVNSDPKLVALIPQLEKMDKNGTMQVLPPGFHVIYLPYADNIRTLDIKSTKDASPSQVAKMKQVVTKLRFKYEPTLFDNPRLQVHWSNIEALALEHDEPRDVPDYTVPNHEKMRKKLGSLSRELLDTVYPAGYDPYAKKIKPAYKRANDAGGAGETKAKVAKPGPSAQEVTALVRTGKAAKLTVPQLKSYLTSAGVQYSSSSPKAALVTLVENHAKR